jgi:hypothetical protein
MLRKPTAAADSPAPPAAAATPSRRSTRLRLLAASGADVNGSSSSTDPVAPVTSTKLSKTGPSGSTTMNTLDATLDNASTSSTTPKESAKSKKTSKADSSGSTTRFTTTQLLPANASVSDDLYEAEKIVDKMIRKDGKPEYRIRWMGCNKDQDTWEPLENLPEILLLEYDEVVSQNGNKGPTSL